MTSGQDERPRLSVVLSTLGNYRTLAMVLDGYERQDAPAGSFELIVVSDLAERNPGAVDAAIGRRGFPVRKLTGGIPGLSANRNTGWKAARAPIVLFTDNDTIPVPALISEHLRSHAMRPKQEWAVAGHVRWARGLRVTPFMRWLDSGIQFDYGSLAGAEGTWAHLYGANSSIKRSMLEQVGGYDEERLPYLYEDLDWGLRASRSGLRVHYNARAVVDHWRPMTVEIWQRRAPMLAAAEWRFCELHPEVQPHFWTLFREALVAPPARGRAARLAGVIPRWLPGLGPFVWDRADLWWRQQLAPPFAAVWERAAAGDPISTQPDVEALLSEREASSGGSPPGGPK